MDSYKPLRLCRTVAAAGAAYAGRQLPPRPNATTMRCPASLHRLVQPAPALLLAALVLTAAGPSCAASDAPSPLPGKQLRLALGPRTSMVYEPRPLPPLQPLAVQPDTTAPSIGLEFKRAPGHAAGPQGLLRVQLSADAALQFRPRRGGLAVSYRAQF